MAGWVYRVGNTGTWDHPPTARAEVPRSTPPAERAPEGPAGAWSGWVGCGGTDPFAHPPSCSPAHPACSRARSVPVGPPWQGAGLLAGKRRHLTSFSIKLVKTAECHQKSRKRPLIVPISKTGPRIHLLKFWDFRFRWPSLTRN